MPFINLCVSKDVSNDEEISLKEEFGKAIKIIPGKSEDWLMINITSNAHMYFKGNNDKPNGFLLKGQVVMVKKGMRINVTRTNKS